MAHTDGFFARRRNAKTQREFEASLPPAPPVKTQDLIEVLRARKAYLATAIATLQREHDAITV